MTRPSRYPVSSFGPELLEILVRGAKDRVSIPCPNHKTMQALQMRIQMLRGAMGREKHPQYELTTRARTSRTWNREAGKDVDCVLVIQPNDFQFSDILKSAGITPSAPMRDILDDTALPDTPSDPSIESTSPDKFDNPYNRFK